MWQPIETAPRDGSYVLLAFADLPDAQMGYYKKTERYENGKLSYRSEGWRGWFFADSAMPIYWMSIPKAPQ